MAKRVKVPDVATVDFETHPIESRPAYPPKPVGVSIIMPGETRSKYWAFGHPTGNNCTEAQARRALELAYKSAPVLCHHAKFDLDVAETHWGLRLPAWHDFHETMFLLFYMDPHGDLQLKPAAEKLLGMKPEERDALLDFAVAQKWVPRTAKKIGHLIWKMPGDLVGRYADGDTVRTLRLFKKAYPYAAERSMLEAYDRDRRLMPILLQNEREGIESDVRLMKKDAKLYAQAQESSDAWLRKQLKSPSLNIDSDAELADALVASGRADPDLFMLTPSGNRSVAKDSLIGAVTDKKVLQVLQYRSRLGTSKGTFLDPWLAEAEASGGRVFPSWNQVRTVGAKGSAGARTGRMSASRFMNVPKEFEEKEGVFEMPRFKGFAGLDGGVLPDLPLVRKYCLPDKGTLWCKRDYSQQEIRVLAHYEDGALLARYLDDPAMDVHTVAAQMMLAEQGFPFTLQQMRKLMKTIGFGLIYGMGLGAMAEKMGVDMATAKRLRDAYLALFPGLKDLQDNLKAMAANDEPLRTWGGREYFCEPPKFSKEKGRVLTFEYKLINYLIQGSSADCTKEAIIRYHDVRKDGRFLVTVHDELDFCAPRGAVKSEMKIMRDVMASIEFDVVMLSDGATGKSWGDLADYKEAA